MSRYVRTIPIGTPDMFADMHNNIYPDVIPMYDPSYQLTENKKTIDADVKYADWVSDELRRDIDNCLVKGIEIKHESKLTTTASGTLITKFEIGGLLFYLKSWDTNSHKSQQLQYEQALYFDKIQEIQREPSMSPNFVTPVAYGYTNVNWLDKGKLKMFSLTLSPSSEFENNPIQSITTLEMFLYRSNLENYKCVVLQLLYNLILLMSMGIYHGDLHAANILVAEHENPIDLTYTIDEKWYVCTTKYVIRIFDWDQSQLIENSLSPESVNMYDDRKMNIKLNKVNMSSYSVHTVGAKQAGLIDFHTIFCLLYGQILENRDNEKILFTSQFLHPLEISLFTEDIDPYSITFNSNYDLQYIIVTDVDQVKSRLEKLRPLKTFANRGQLRNYYLLTSKDLIYLINKGYAIGQREYYRPFKSFQVTLQLMVDTHTGKEEKVMHIDKFFTCRIGLEVESPMRRLREAINVFTPSDTWKGNVYQILI